MRDFLRSLKNEVLLMDSAMGSMLQRAGLKTGIEYGEVWNLTNREKVQAVHRANVEAGSDIILTNTFGGGRFKLIQYGLADQAYEINRRAAENAREVAGDSVFVAGDMGPSGEILESSGGTRKVEEVYETFKEQAVALAEGGVDLIIVETMMDGEEARAAIGAAKEHTGLPVIGSMAFSRTKQGFRTQWGVDPARAAREMASVGADVVGANCMVGIEDMVELMAAFRTATDDYLIAQPNAGNPEVVDGVTVYRQTAEEMAERAADLLKAGAKIIGGCCGTTPEFVRLTAEIVKGKA